jgi:hypothetical protein
MSPERAPRDAAAYQALLESLADGVDVDWGALDAAATSSIERRRYSNLRLVARVAELHRTLPPDDAPPPQRAEAEETTLERLTSWGHLVINERIGGGAYGDVYRASDPQLSRDVALKLLRADRDGSADRLLA